MVTLRIRIPAPSRGVMSNLVGLAGLAAICAAVAVLTWWPWALLAAGVFAVTLAVIAQIGERAVPDNVRNHPAVRPAA